MINKIQQPCIALLKSSAFCLYKTFCSASPAVHVRVPKKRKIIYQKDGKTFVDWRRLFVAGGQGGNGSAAFMHARSHKGGPYGGDGGQGGDVYVMADANLTHLAHLKGHYRAKKGDLGSNSWKHGKKGPRVTFYVPVGTTIIDSDTGDVIGDLVENGEELLLVQGGEPGLGNDHFKGPDMVRPKEFTVGGPGEERYIEIELKSIADIGLVGFPNAGKSTLLTALSRAKPKVADYPFTTLQPNIGVIQYEDGTNIKVADIPGLVEGAHENKGLGHVFLRHVERCNGLIYVVDVNSTNPFEQFDILKRELELYKSRLSSLPSLFVANKIDLLKEDTKILEELRDSIEMPFIGISGKQKYNIGELKSLIFELNK